MNSLLANALAAIDSATPPPKPAPVRAPAPKKPKVEIPPWLDPVNRPGEVCLSELRGELRKKAWAHIQAREPDLADMLANDQGLANFRSFFGARVWVPLTQAGLADDPQIHAALAEASP